MSSSPAFICICLSILAIIAQAASVSSSATFKYVNEGEFGEYIVEYGASYRVLDLFNSPFQLCFYNTTPNAFTLALRMGTVRSESLMRWVWEANRGNPVGEKATLTFRQDGNLVLAEANGRVAWQTNTANKGVVGFKLLANGNMVLHDANGKFIWQSFDSPTDTLLVGQSLRIGGATRLISRASVKDNANGAYTLLLEPKRLAMYYQTPNSAKPYLYYTSDRISISRGRLDNVTLISTPDTKEAYAYDITLGLSAGGETTLSRPKYNSTLSFLRLGVDGNLRVYTYYDKVDWGAWEVTFTLFSRDSSWETECQLPERCGNFGVCDEDSQCVACPLPNGLMGWSKNCEAVKPPSCGSKKFGYYKVDGVEHFLSKYGKGGEALKESDCEKKCSSDCKCLGYFYNSGSSRCLIAYDLKTLTKVADSTHVGFIKVPN